MGPNTSPSSFSSTMFPVSVTTATSLPDPLAPAPAFLGFDAAGPLHPPHPNSPPANTRKRDNTAAPSVLFKVAPVIAMVLPGAGLNWPGRHSIIFLMGPHPPRSRSRRCRRPRARTCPRSIPWRRAGRARRPRVHVIARRPRPRAHPLPSRPRGGSSALSRCRPHSSRPGPRRRHPLRRYHDGARRRPRRRRPCVWRLCRTGLVFLQPVFELIDVSLRQSALAPARVVAHVFLVVL